MKATSGLKFKDSCDKLNDKIDESLYTLHSFR